uniref:HTH OST-type domain-containing protein n=1 Tax=Strongyloides stercoralis TaxID=6248 RepID=A0A0K0EF36_STRER
MKNSIMDWNRKIDGGWKELQLSSVINDKNVYNDSKGLLNNEKTLKDSTNVSLFNENNTKQLFNKDLKNYGNYNSIRNSSIEDRTDIEIYSNDSMDKNNVDGIYVKLATKKDVKLPSNNSRKRQNVKNVDNKTINYYVNNDDTSISGPYKKNDYKLNDHVYVSNNTETKKNQPSKVFAFSDTEILLSMECGSQISPPRKKICYSRCLKKTSSKRLIRPFIDKNNATMESLTNISSFNKNDNDSYDMIDETLSLLDEHGNYNNIENDENKESKCNFLKGNNCDSEAFGYYLKSNIFNTKILSTISGENEEFEEFDVDNYKNNKENVDFSFLSETGEKVDKYVNNFLYKRIERLKLTNAQNLLLEKDNFVASNITTCQDENNENNKHIKEVSFDNDENNFENLRVYKTIVKASKENMLIQSAKGKYTPISPLATYSQPLKEIKFFELYKDAGFYNLYPYPKTLFNINSNNIFVDPLKMLPHEGHLFASFFSYFKQSNSFQKEENNYLNLNKNSDKQLKERNLPQIQNESLSGSEVTPNINCNFFNNNQSSYGNSSNSFNNERNLFNKYF